VLVPYAGGTLPDDARALVAMHLERCARCREDVADAIEERRGFRRRRAIISWMIAAAIGAAAVTAILLYRSSPRSGAKGPVAFGRTAEARDWIELVRQARASRRVDPPPAFTAVRASSSALRGRDGLTSRALLTPSNDVVESRQPPFGWPASKDGRYVVRLFDNEQEVANSGMLSIPKWTPPQPLRRGATYTWQVDVHGAEEKTLPAPPDPLALFSVAGDREMAEIDDARRRLPDDHLLIGLLYARAGMRGRAIAELGAWVAAHPRDDAARDLLESIRNW